MTNETISFAGYTSDGVAVLKTLDQEVITLSEVAEAMKVFLHAFGYDYVTEVVIEAESFSHSSGGF